MTSQAATPRQTKTAHAPPAARRPGRPRHAVARDDFLNAAVCLFGEQGVAATTLAHIAQAVGVTSAAVHYHFANREQLLDAVVTERLLPFIEHVWSPISPATLADPRQALIDIAQRMLTGVQRWPWIPSVWLNEIASKTGELHTRVFAHLPVEKVHGLTEAIAHGQAHGDINPALAPHMMFASLAGLILVPLASADFCAQVHPAADHSPSAFEAHVNALLVTFLQAPPNFAPSALQAIPRGQE